MTICVFVSCCERCQIAKSVERGRGWRRWATQSQRSWGAGELTAVNLVPGRKDALPKFELLWLGTDANGSRSHQPHLPPANENKKTKESRVAQQRVQPHRRRTLPPERYDAQQPTTPSIQSKQRNRTLWFVNHAKKIFHDHHNNHHLPNSYVKHLNCVSFAIM